MGCVRQVHVVLRHVHDERAIRVLHANVLARPIRGDCVSHITPDDDVTLPKREEAKPKKVSITVN